MYAHYALHKLRMLPSEFLNLNRKEKAFVIASIQVKIDSEKEAQEEAERKARNAR